MSARNTLLDLFLHGGDGSQPEFEQALDNYAHELAEKIRAKADTFGSWDFTTRRDMREAANLIDPEAA
ncbi:hypothetical protein GA0115253_100479 [Streptomyces sp. Termitarium-T10T-6]|nr:hypothetical protein [Streptomyces sp. Termitarium-T10T-6]SCD43778.1 hypothetical protein GA0115253_100479 [Streptomyces sp. Termitarium-T10T-6]